MKKEIQIIIEKLKSLQGGIDTESAHSEADNLLCELLIKLGYKNVVEEWEKVPKWYA